MATIDKKQKRWYSKSTFDSLDKTAIPVGTEIQVGGEIEETDLAADLKTKINGKLTAPTTPTADSVVTMLANGTTGTKALSDFGGKLYNHRIRYSYTNVSTLDTDVYIDIITSSNIAFTQPSEFISLVNKKIAIVDGMHIRGSAFVQEAGNNSISIYGCGYNVNNTTSPVTIFTQLDVSLFVNDTVIEL